MYTTTLSPNLCKNIPGRKDLTNRRGETPLMMAAEKRRTSAVRFLLDKGSDFKRGDDNKDTAIISRGGAALQRAAMVNIKTLLNP